MWQQKDSIVIVQFAQKVTWWHELQFIHKTSCTNFSLLVFRSWIAPWRKCPQLAPLAPAMPHHDHKGAYWFFFFCLFFKLLHCSFSWRCTNTTSEINYKMRSLSFLSDGADAVSLTSFHTLPPPVSICHVDLHLMAFLWAEKNKVDVVN